MGAAEEERRARLLAAEMAEHDHLVVALDPVEALSVIGLLQLALRHPTVPAGPAEIARGFIDQVVHAYGLRGPDSREFARVVAEGFDPDADLDVDARRDAAPPEMGRHGDVAGIPVVLDESLPPGVLEVRGETTTRIRVGDWHPVGERGGVGVVRAGDELTGAILREHPRAWFPPAPTRADVVRPAGLVWSGIRVDEMPRLYEVLDRSHEACPVPLEHGEIIGDPATGRVFVWSIADFDRLAELSRRLHDARRRGDQLESAVLRELPGPIEQVESAEIVRALPAREV